MLNSCKKMHTFIPYTCLFNISKYHFCNNTSVSEKKQYAYWYMGIPMPNRTSLKEAYLVKEYWLIDFIYAVSALFRPYNGCVKE